MPLSPKARATNAAIHEGNVRAVVQLAGNWGLSADHRIDSAVKLDRRAGRIDSEEEFALLNVSGQANVRTISDVWRRRASGAQ